MSVKGRQFTGKMQNNVSTLRDQYIFATMGKTGSGRVSLDTVGRKFAQMQTAQVVESGSTDNILNLTGHTLKEGWLVRIMTTANGILEEEILVDEVIDANNVRLSGFLSASLAAGDTVDIYKPVFERVAADGSSLATVVSPPIQIIKNGIVTTVEDSTNPSDVVAIPVLIKGVDGTNITINAGDISVQNSAEGANFDSIRVGDGTAKYAGITANDELKTHDADVLAALSGLATGLATAVKQDAQTALLTSIEGKDFATAVKQDAQTALLTAINGKDFATQTTLASLLTRANLLATEAKQDTQIARLNLLATETTLAALKARGDLLATEAKQDTQITQLTNLNTATGTQADTAATTDTGTFSQTALFKRHLQQLQVLLSRTPVLGQAAKVGSVPVVLASDSDNLKINESNTAGQMQKNTLSASTNATAIAPANATGCFIKNQLESAGTLYYEIGGTANAVSADLSGGQGTAFIPCTGTISLFAGPDGACNYSVQWLIK